MSRLCLFLLLAVAGCSAPSSPPPASGASAPAGDEIDFAAWPKVREEPYPVEAQTALACEAATPDRVTKWADEGKKIHGPHYHPAIVVRVNPAALDAFKSRKGPLPVGTTVIKEKHADLDAKGPSAEYAAMVKREPGYDPAHGDWEYVYVVRGPEKKVTRGKLDACIDCHANRAEQDYVFRTYLK